MIDTKESVTAKICSFARAYHSNYSKQKIFDDYLAYDMMGKEEYDATSQQLEQFFINSKCDFFDDLQREEVWRSLNEYIAPIPLSRISFAEQRLLQFSQEHEECQYVICGAGMDTFAFRNANPHIQIFELDHPDTQNYKLSRIRELSWNIPRNVNFVPIDFEIGNMKEALFQAGFQPEIPAFFSILGVTYYLELPVFEETVRNIAELSANGNLLVFDYPDRVTPGERHVRILRLAEITALLGEEMKEGYPYSLLNDALENHRFTVERHMTPADIQSTYFENRIDNVRAFENVHLISAIFKGE
jgi:methyltransferase (TIGR00027 family)